MSTHCYLAILLYFAFVQLILPTSSLYPEDIMHWEYLQLGTSIRQLHLLSFILPITLQIRCDHHSCLIGEATEAQNA